MRILTLTCLLCIAFPLSLMAANHFTEDFTLFTDSGYAGTGMVLSSGTWAKNQAMGEYAADSRGGTGRAARINDETNGAHITTPSVDSVGALSFYYRELNTGGGPTNQPPSLALIPASTNKTDSNSYFAVENAESLPAGAGMVLRWTTASNRVYGVGWSTSLVTGFSDAATNLPATPPENAYTDTVHSAGESGFYRIDVRLDDR